MSEWSPTVGAPRQDMSSVSGRRCSRCSLIVRRLQGLLASNPGDVLRAPSGIWRQPILRVLSIEQRDSACSRWAGFPLSSGGSAVLVDQLADRGPVVDRGLRSMGPAWVVHWRNRLSATAGRGLARAVPFPPASRQGRRQNNHYGVMPAHTTRSTSSTKSRVARWCHSGTSERAALVHPS
jgi:hypothetical protein